jgi:hypothetical protein
MERVKGIEPSYSAWKADVLPLNYTRLKMVGKTGFEPATSWSQTKRSTKLSYFPTFLSDIGYYTIIIIPCQLFFTRKWHAREDLNPQPLDP